MAYLPVLDVPAMMIGGVLVLANCYCGRGLASAG